MQLWVTPGKWIRRSAIEYYRNLLMQSTTTDKVLSGTFEDSSESPNVDRLVDSSHAVTSLIKQNEVRDEAMNRDSFFESEDDGDGENERRTYKIEEDDPKIESLKQFAKSKTVSQLQVRQKDTPTDPNQKALESNWLKRNIYRMSSQQFSVFRGKRRVSSEESPSKEANERKKQEKESTK